MSIDERIDVIGRHPSRARFALRGRERAMAGLHGEIPHGEALDADQQVYAVDVTCRWIEREFGRAA